MVVVFDVKEIYRLEINRHCTGTKRRLIENERCRPVAKAEFLLVGTFDQVDHEEIQHLHKLNCFTVIMCI